MINDLLGLPSGQIVNVTKRELETLMNLDFIQWSSTHDYFIFRDTYLSEIKRFTKRFYENELVVTGTGRQGAIEKVISSYDGGKVNGRDVSKIFKIGDVIYVVRLENDKMGLYKEDQLKKIRNNKSINENNQNTPNDIIDIIGIPSGQVIEVFDNEVQYLKGHGLVKWNGSRTGTSVDFIGYSFDDKDKKKIMDTLYEIY